MSNFFKSCCSKPASDDHSLDDGECVLKGKKMVEWKMPNVPNNIIFQGRINKCFNISSQDPTIRTTETKLSFGIEGTFQVYPYIPCGNFHGYYDGKMNIGLVQIGVKTLTRKFPPNSSIFVCLRDNRIAQVTDCFLALVESKLSDGPFYFNVFPNTTLSLHSSMILNNVLSVHLIVEGFDELPKGSEPIVVTCRTCYKLNHDNFGAEALIESPVGKTVFFQTPIVVDDKESDVVQKVTIWDQVQLPSNWPSQLEINRWHRR